MAASSSGFWRQDKVMLLTDALNPGNQLDAAGRLGQARILTGLFGGPVRKQFV